MPPVVGRSADRGRQSCQSLSISLYFLRRMETWSLNSTGSSLIWECTRGMPPNQLANLFMQVCRWAKWSGSAQRDALEDCWEGEDKTQDHHAAWILNTLSLSYVGLKTPRLSVKLSLVAIRGTCIQVFLMWSHWKVTEVWSNRWHYLHCSRVPQAYITHDPTYSHSFLIIFTIHVFCYPNPRLSCLISGQFG